MKILFFRKCINMGSLNIVFANCTLLNVYSRAQTHSTDTAGRSKSQDVKDSDIDSDDDEELIRRRVPKVKKRKSGNKVKPAPKEKKEKKISPPPLPETNADRFQVNNEESLKGLCISVELTHVLEGNEKIACSLSSANLNDGTHWKVLSNTENYKLNEEKSSSNFSGETHRITHQFNLLQDLQFLENSTHMLVILYKASGKKGPKKKGENTTPICSGIIRCDELLATGGITQVKMAISTSVEEISTPSISKEESSYNDALAEANATVASATPTANLGVVILSSPILYRRRMKLINDMKFRPYGESMYCFRTLAGENLVLEQIFASRYSLVVAKAMLQLIIPERRSILSDTKKTVKNDLKKAIGALKDIPSKAALQELDDMLTGGGEFEGEIDLLMILL